MKGDGDVTCVSFGGMDGWIGLFIWLVWKDENMIWRWKRCCFELLMYILWKTLGIQNSFSSYFAGLNISLT